MSKSSSLGVLIAVSIALVAIFNDTTFAQPLPNYYPPAYANIIEASKAESGLFVYSEMSEKAWAPVLEAFRNRYPWIKKIETLNLGTDEIFERYYVEVAGGARTGDLIVSLGSSGWLRFMQRNEVIPYVSPEIPNLPEWSYNKRGVYTYSTDPVVMAYSRVVFDDKTAPRGIAHLAEMVAKNPASYAGKLTTYMVEEEFDTFWAFVRHHGENAWKWLDILGPASRPMKSSGTMVEGIMTGQYVAAYFSGIGNPRRTVATPAGARLLGYRYVEDGNVLWKRGIGVSAHSSSPNCAKLLLDFILSREGQIAVAKGDYTAYRPDTFGVAQWHRQQVVNEIGEKNVLLVTYDEDLLNPQRVDAFIKRWRQAMFGK